MPLDGDGVPSTIGPWHIPLLCASLGQVKLIARIWDKLPTSAIRGWPAKMLENGLDDRRW
jgi:hypothetical protein